MQRIKLNRRGLMLVLSSPSGAGKTTLSRLLLASEAGLTMSVSITTRPIRPGEIDGMDYTFIAEAEFIRQRDNGDLLEHAKVFDHYYGTPARPIGTALGNGQDVLFDIDWQGTQQLKASARDDLVAVFILPPSRDDLQRRLTTRAQDSASVVNARMARASDEMSHWPEYDYVVINDDVQAAHQELRAILTAERLKRERQTGLPDFVKNLREGG